MTRLWSKTIANNPEAFVLMAFPWGQPNTPLAKFRGPRKWQREVLRTIAQHIKDNDGKLDMETFRLAVSSGRGIGKSALVSWLILWMLSTRIGSTVIVSANSEAQLRSVTWGELTKWAAMIINAHWWEISATKLMPAKWVCELVERDLKKGTRYWAAEGKLWSEENPDSYAGVHNHDGMMLIFDEASGIPDSIWSVGAGFFTENILDRYWCAFSNPRRNSGYFFETFHGKRDFWKTKQVDARTVEDQHDVLAVEPDGARHSLGALEFLGARTRELLPQRRALRDLRSEEFLQISVDPKPHVAELVARCADPRPGNGKPQGERHQHRIADEHPSPGQSFQTSLKAMNPKLARPEHAIQGLGRKVGVGQKPTEGQGEGRHRGQQGRKGPCDQENSKALKRRGIESAARELGGKFTQTVARVLDHKALLPLQGQGKQRAQGEAGGQQPQHVNLESGPVGTGEGEAHIPIARICQPEGQRAIH